MAIILLILNFIAFTWWIWAFLLFFPMLTSLWLYYRRSIFKSAINWSVLELRIPRQINRSARAMEQILASIHSLRNAPDSFKEIYIEGQVTRWFSLEIVSFGGEVHFYIRCPEQFKTLIQAPIFSYYPDVEIVDVEDYVEVLPKNTAEMYARDLDIWGTEIGLAKEPAYPIKTYPNFESGSAENSFDPIATLLEVLGKMRKEEMAAVQINIVPKDNKEWREKWKAEVDKLRAKIIAPLGEESKSVEVKTKYDFSFGVLPVITSEASGSDGKTFPAWPTPGVSNAMGAVENNISKPAFDTIIRVMYMGPKAAFYDSFVRQGVMSSFQQYATLDLNAFKPNNAAGTKAAPNKFPFLFAKERTEYKKQRFLYNFRRRELPEPDFMGVVMTSYLLNFNNKSQLTPMSTETLATIFHVPTQSVIAAPHIKKVESRKVGPPAGIAIYGEDEEIDKFQ